jgi:hypothetical protein
MDFVLDEHFRYSRMYIDDDLTHFSRYKYFCKYRPRKILSGFLVIKNNTSPIEFIQQHKPKMTIPLRIDESFTKSGPAIFLAYLYRKTGDDFDTLILEDIFVYENKNLFSTMNFEDRWKIMDYFVNNKTPKIFTPDRIISNNIKVECAEYKSLSELEKHKEYDVLDMVPNNKNMKKIIILLEKEDDSEIFIAEKIVGKGPDLFFLKKSEGDEYLEKIAAIQSLAISKALRKLTTAKVKCKYNEKFEKYEIIEVL